MRKMYNLHNGKHRRARPASITKASHEQKKKLLEIASFFFTYLMFSAALTHVFLTAVERISI